jgi:adenylate cyclase
VAINFKAEGLLEGVEGDDARAARVELLELLAGQGVPMEELKRATAEDRLVLLPVERVLDGGGPRYTREEVAERSGVEADFLEALWRALGVARAESGEAMFTEADVEAARRVRRFREAGIPPEGILEISRVMGQGMANLSATVGRTFAEALIRPGDTERDLGLRYAEGAGELIPLLADELSHVLRLHQRELARQAAVGDAEIRSGRMPGAQEISVCFADMAGFTKLGERVAPDELGEVAGRLSELATEVASPPVRLVKTIGDAAMLVSPDADGLLSAALELVEAADEQGEGFPRLHAGVARGPALARGGDFYGATVNRASRITSFAKPGSVVAAAEVREVAGGRWRWSFAGRRSFRGLKGEVKVFRVRREEPE